MSDIRSPTVTIADGVAMPMLGLGTWQASDQEAYNAVRTALGHGSGFDSPGFRGIARATPAVGAAFDRALARTGVPLPELYRRRREFEPLHLVAELLTDFDERLRLWRFRHYSVVARAIGEEGVGIQGVEVQMLAKLIAQRQLPKLWEVRARLVEQFAAERED